jgi:hypothetical protein
MFPKSKAVKDKFIYDPEHGGGRRRRQKHLPRQPLLNDDDQIGNDTQRMDFNKRLNSPNNMLQPPMNQNFSSPTNPFEIAQDV